MAAAMNKPTLALSLSTRASAEVQTQDGAHQRFHKNPFKIEVDRNSTFKQYIAIYIANSSNCNIKILKSYQKSNFPNNTCAI